jgi:hypothetical protein
VAISNVGPPIQQALERMCDRYFGVGNATAAGINTAAALTGW